MSFRLSGVRCADNSSRFNLSLSLLGFFRSIALRSQDALQDTLRLLTLWFKFGSHDDVSTAMIGGFSSVEVDTWLEVIPQVSQQISLQVVY